MTPKKTTLLLLPLALISGILVVQSNRDPVPRPIEPISTVVKDGIDPATGFVAEGDYMIVRAHCTACHSSKLVLQNRATRDGWEQMIRWMQASQKLWSLGENEDKILDYLATHYAPVEQGRRAPLAIAGRDWYKIAGDLSVH